MYEARPPASFDLDPRGYDLWIFDLDGTLHVGETAFPDARGWVNHLAVTGRGVAYVTNNPYEPLATITARLNRMGFPLAGPAGQPFPVLTAAQAAAYRLRRQLAPGAPVLYLGAAGLVEALEGVGLQPVRAAGSGAPEPAAVVVGGTPHWTNEWIQEVARAGRRDVPFVVTNRDTYYPVLDGIRLATGALVDRVEAAVGRRGETAGKPEPDLFILAAQAFPGARKPIVVGDNFDTDVAGARAAGWPAIWLNRKGFPRPTAPAMPPDEPPVYELSNLSALLSREGIEPAHPA